MNGDIATRLKPRRFASLSAQHLPVGASGRKLVRPVLGLGRRHAPYHTKERGKANRWST
jgi:hypothetical protein